MCFGNAHKRNARKGMMCLIVFPLFLLAAGCSSFAVDKMSEYASRNARSPDERNWPLWREPDFRLPARCASGSMTNGLPAAAWVSCEPLSRADSTDHAVFFTWPSGECLHRTIDYWQTQLPEEYRKYRMSTNEVLARAFAPDFSNGTMGFWAVDGDRVEIEVYTGHGYRTWYGRRIGDRMELDSFEDRKSSNDSFGCLVRNTSPRPWVFRREPMPDGMPSPDWTATRFTPPRPPKPSKASGETRRFRWGLSFAGAEDLFDEPAKPSHGTFGEYDFTGVQFGVSGRIGRLDGMQFGLAWPAAEDVVGLQFGLLGADAVHEVWGIQVGGFSAAVDRSFHGIQIAGLFPLAGRVPDPLGLRDDDEPPEASWGLQAGLLYPTAVELDGLQLALVHASAFRLRGVQASLFTASTESLSGIQASFGSPNAAHIDGVQLGIDVWAGEMNGLQAGIFTCAEELHGLQIGLYNRARGGEGVQIGLVNVFGPTLADARWLPLLNARF